MTEETEKSTQKRKIVDRPHLVTVVFSTVAVVISVFSYLESHRSRLLSEEVNRPLVRAIALELIGPVMDKEQFKGSKQENAYTISFRNSGKAFATDVQIQFKAQLNDSRVGQGLARFSDFEDATIRSESIGDLAPDDEYPLSFWASVMKDPPTIPFGTGKLSMVSLYVIGKATYTNPINHLQYKQPFCFLDAGTSGHFRHCSTSDSH